MSFEVTPLSEIELRARMFCEAPLCSARATHRSVETSAFDGEDPRTSQEFLCDRHTNGLREAIARAKLLRAGHS
jgi:hypothetical protein